MPTGAYRIPALLLLVRRLRPRRPVVPGRAPSRRPVRRPVLPTRRPAAVASVPCMVVRSSAGMRGRHAPVAAAGWRSTALTAGHAARAAQRMGPGAVRRAAASAVRVRQVVRRAPCGGQRSSLRRLGADPPHGRRVWVCRGWVCGGRGPAEGLHKRVLLGVRFGGAVWWRLVWRRCGGGCSAAGSSCGLGAGQLGVCRWWEGGLRRRSGRRGRHVSGHVCTRRRGELLWLGSLLLLLRLLCGVAYCWLSETRGRGRRRAAAGQARTPVRADRAGGAAGRAQRR